MNLQNQIYAKHFKHSSKRSFGLLAVGPRYFRIIILDYNINLWFCMWKWIKLMQSLSIIYIFILDDLQLQKMNTEETCFGWLLLSIDVLSLICHWYIIHYFFRKNMHARLLNTLFLSVLMQQMTVAKAQAGVKNNLRRLNRSIVRNGSNHIVHVVLFALICFTIVYLWSKMSRKWGFPGRYFSQHCCWTQVFLWMTHNDAWVCCIEKLCNFLCVTGGFYVMKKDNMVFCSLQSRTYVKISSGEILIIHKKEQDSGIATWVT